MSFQQETGQKLFLFSSLLKRMQWLGEINWARDRTMVLSDRTKFPGIRQDYHNGSERIRGRGFLGTPSISWYFSKKCGKVLWPAGWRMGVGFRLEVKTHRADLGVFFSTALQGLGRNPNNQLDGLEF